jgi:hypothetical protein
MVQASACLIVCLSLSFQGGQFMFSAQEFSFTRIFSSSFKPSLYVGISLGINTTTPAESVHNNRIFGAAVADGLGGGVGASGYVGQNGLGPVRPYAYGTVGAGFQVTGGEDQTWDLNSIIARQWDTIF